MFFVLLIEKSKLLLISVIAFVTLVLLFFWADARAQISTVMYSEAPVLATAVHSGILPTLEHRLPLNPMVIQPVSKIGKYGGTWHLGMIRKMDQAIFIRYVGYENLMRWDPSWTKVIPNVAQSLIVNKDSSVFTFSLRQNLRWSDGHPFTADDIMFWYEDILLNKDLTKQYPSSLVVEGKLVQVSKIDDYTVSFHFARPYGLFPQVLAQPHLVDATMYPKHYLKSFHPKYNKQIAQVLTTTNVKNWVELFLLKFGKPLTIDDPSRWKNPELPTLNAWVQKQPYQTDVKSITFERNPYYWKIDTAGNQLPYIDTIKCKIVDTAEEVAQLAVAGKIDMQRRRMDARPRSDFEKVKQRHRFHLFETMSSFSNTLVIALNLTHQDFEKRKIYQNRDFRIGLSYAINRKRIIESVPGMLGRPYQPSPRPETSFYDPEFSNQFTSYDKFKANYYLDQSGLQTKDPKGFRIDLSKQPITVNIEYTDFMVGWERALKMIAEDWQDVGIKTSIHKYSRDILYNRKSKNLHDAVVWLGDGGMSVLLEPRWYLPYSYEANYAPLWQKAYNNLPGGEEPPALIRKQMSLYDQIKVTADSAEQHRLMKEILNIAKQQFYAIGISLPAGSYGIVKNNFKNVPQVMPYSWIYPTPAPTNTCQYFFEN